MRQRSSLRDATVLGIVALMTTSASSLAQSSQPSPAGTPPAGGAATATPTSAARELTAADLKPLAWRSIGPAIMGGRVADIYLQPGKPSTFYVALGTGGLWKTTNNGVTFSPLMDKEVTASIGSVVVADAPPDWPGWKDDAPSPAELAARQELQNKDPEKFKKSESEKGRGKVVWVGTGEGNNRNSSSWGHGVYRSTDAGGEFKNVGLKETHNIPALAVDPRNPDVCYVAALGRLWGTNAERGIYKTSDGGATWNAVLQIDDSTGACDVILDPRNPDTVYAAMYTRRRTAWSYSGGSEVGGIFRSNDAGKSWTKLTNGLPKRTARIGLDIYAKDTKILYAVVESDEGGWGVEPFDDRSKAGGVFRSDDGGDTWSRVNPFTPRAFYFSKIRVDPTDDQRVYVLGWTLWISDDAGKNFRAGGARRPHGDMHALAINPENPDHMVMGTDGGVYISWDKAATWDFRNNTAIGEFYNVAVDDFGEVGDDYRVAGGLQDNCSWIGVSGTGMQSKIGSFSPSGGEESTVGITNADWRLITGGDGFHVAFDRLDPHVFYSEWQGGNLIRTHLDTGFQKYIKPSAKEGQPKLRFNWNAPFLLSRHEPTTIYFAGNHVFKLTSRGDAWEQISSDLSTKDPAKIMSVGSDAETHGTVVSLAESHKAAGTLWAGTDDGLIHVTSDDGKSWANVTPPEVGGRYIAKIEASHHDALTAYVAVDGHRSDDYDPMILATSDLGKSWRNITADLPKGWSVKCVREDLRSPDVLYAGTENAIYASFDRGQRWIRLNGESLPTVAVDDIVQHPREFDLIVGTHGRSIYILDDASCFSQLTPERLAMPMTVFDIMPAKPRMYLPYEGAWGDGFFTASNPPMGATITYWLRDRQDDPVSIAITDSKGTTIRKLTGSNRQGLSRVVWDLQREPYDRYADPSRDGVPQFVPAGEYTVTITCGKLKPVSAKVRVAAAPLLP